MTLIQGTFRNSRGIPISGLVRIRLDYRVLDNDSPNVFLPIAADVQLVNGALSVDLEPSDLAKVTYLFEVIQVTPANGTEPAFETVIESFRAKIPFSATPIDVTVLMNNTGITQDALDAAQVSIVRRLYNDENFWSRVQQEIFVHRGLWTSTTLYRRGDMVHYQGSSYLYVNTIAQTQQAPLIAVNGSTVGNTTYWQLMGAKGATGAGTTGDNNPYDPIAWDNQLAAVSQNAVRDIVETLATKAELSTKVSSIGANLTAPTLNTVPILTDRSSLVPSTNWVQQLLDQIRKAIIPVGILAPWVSTSPPQYWVICDGRLLSRITYSALFAVIGTTFNTSGEDSTNFRIPDLRGRTIVSMDNVSTLMGLAGVLTDPQANTIGGKLGSQSVALTVSQLPSHNHTGRVGVKWTDGQAIANMEYIDATIAAQAAVPADGVLAGRNRMPLIVDPTGNNAAHPNIQPSYAMTYIVYTGV